MKRVPTITAKTMISFLKSMGFELLRQKGSHKFFKHPDGRSATIPEHKGEDLGRGITLKILKDIDISSDDFAKWLSK